MSFVAYRQFASNRGIKELKEVHVRLPDSSEIAPDGTVVYPATVWDKKELLVLEKYYASLDGDIWSVNTGSLKKLSPSKKQQISLCVDGKQRLFYVHRIVASTFLSGIRHPGQTEVDHIIRDKDIGKNAVVNLRWCTKKQNASNKCPLRAKNRAKRSSDLCSIPVQQLCPQTGDVIAEFPSQTAAAKAVGCSKPAISRVSTGQQQTAGGYAWRFAPREMTLENFKSRGFDVVGGTLEEGPYFYFSADHKVYNDKTGKMYEIPIAHNHQYPMIFFGGSRRLVHIVVKAIRMGYKSLAEFDEYLAATGFVVMHDDDADKSDWWNCSRVGTRSENSFDAVRNGCFNTSKSAPRPVVIRLEPNLDAEVWKFDGMREAAFSSLLEAARALAPYSDLKYLAAGIGHSARTGGYFTLKNGVKAWVFAL